MGGIGSGNWYRWNTKTTTEEVKRIDIRYLKKIGALGSYTFGRLSWHCGGEPTGSVTYSTDDQTLNLKFKYRRYGEDWEHTQQQIKLTTTPCHFGGYRYWFVCPRCGARVGILYGLDVLFLCRHCYQLPYSSQQAGKTNNLINQKHKLGKRTFANYEYGYGWGKKKGMHWKTFERLKNQYTIHANQVDNMLNDYLSKLL